LWNESFFSAPQLKRDPLGSMLSDLDSIDELTLRRRRWITRAGVIAIWTAGVILAIRSGWILGFGPVVTPWSYPLREVLLEIAKITLISLGLYDFLRPQQGESSLGRTAKALGVVFVTLVWVTMFSGTDAPGYVYATSNYILLLTAVLLIALLCHLALRGLHALRGGSR
jgi:drug/metabolite transporter superfamily protein YnfA